MGAFHPAGRRVAVPHHPRAGGKLHPRLFHRAHHLDHGQGPNHLVQRPGSGHPQQGGSPAPHVLKRHKSHEALHSRHRLGLAHGGGDGSPAARHHLDRGQPGSRRRHHGFDGPQGPTGPAGSRARPRHGAVPPRRRMGPAGDARPDPRRLAHTGSAGDADGADAGLRGVRTGSSPGPKPRSI